MSEQDEIKPGDTVRLKSGGPVMTVDHMVKDDNNKYWCKWFDEDDKLSGDKFNGHVLVKIDRPDLL